MKIKELMTKTVYSVNNNQSLSDAAQLMWDHDCGWLPVLDESNKVLAAITDRDIAMAAFLNGKCLADLPVSKAQSQSLLACGPEDDIKAVEEIMRSNQIRRIPIMDKTASLLGIVSLNDIALAYQAGKKGVDAKGVSETLAGICSHAHKTHSMTAVA
jgi:CBS domain-containing protein